MAVRQETWTNETIISDTLGCAPDVSFRSHDSGWSMSRWRRMVGSYRLPALPDPIYVAHIGGSQRVHMYDGRDWSERASQPSDATLLPSGCYSGWLVDGELDVVTVTLTLHAGATPTPVPLRFAYNDALGIALARQALATLYEEVSPERNAYLDALLMALRAHLQHSARGVTKEIPNALNSAYRVHRVLALIREHPEADHNIEDLAALAGLNPSHFCKVFRRAMGTTAHQFVMRTKLDKAEHMLTQSELSVAAIADALGFKSQGHFTRVFQQRVGRTPSNFRRKNRKGEE